MSSPEASQCCVTFKKYTQKHILGGTNYRLFRFKVRFRLQVPPPYLDLSNDLALGWVARRVPACLWSMVCNLEWPNLRNTRFSPSYPFRFWWFWIICRVLSGFRILFRLFNQRGRLPNLVRTSATRLSRGLFWNPRRNFCEHSSKSVSREFRKPQTNITAQFFRFS